ncbi:hypothetical protein UFOVP399_13 [uncultured Caudovirales phage]|uniref:Uncharacterized protein n=1 Tax=uncultured Caudovirales phage TaxID=2100421 RepID=A0A6J5M2C5_9CAUD|nr:hypothetical protein UFOVP399_13 [uncultured Caudovirales phage]
MTTPPPGSREAVQALADRLEAHTEQMANTSWGLTMQEWNVISNDILLAARTLRAALAPAADVAGDVEAIKRRHEAALARMADNNWPMSEGRQDVAALLAIIDKMRLTNERV